MGTQIKSYILLLVLLLFYSCGNSQTVIVLEGLPPIKDTIECTTLGIVEEGVLVVKDTVDLQNSACIIPEGTLLQFNGGYIKNGTLIGNRTKIKTSKACFNRVRILGTWNVPIIKSTLFDDLLYDNSLKDVVALADSSINNKITISEGDYQVTAHKSGESCLVIPSNTELILNGNIKLVANNHQGYSIVKVIGNNIKIRGKGEIIGDKNTHNGNTGEWGMGINILNSYNVFVQGITIKECWGDCIYVGKQSRNIIVSDCILDNGRRQGISITSGEKIAILNCIISNVGGTKPEYAIDVEPNKNEIVNDVLIEKCRIYRCCGGITSSGGAKGAHIGSIRINKCSISEIMSHAPIKLRTADYVSIDNCNINNKTIRLVFIFEGVKKVLIRNNVIKAQRFLLEPCSNISLLNNEISCRDFYTKADNESKNRNILIKNNSFKGKIPEIGQSNKRLNIEVSNNKLKK